MNVKPKTATKTIPPKPKRASAREVLASVLLRLRAQRDRLAAIADADGFDPTTEQGHQVVTLLTATEAAIIQGITAAGIGPAHLDILRELNAVTQAVETVQSSCGDIEAAIHSQQ